MASTLLTSQSEDFSGLELTVFINQQTGESTESLVEAIMMFGLSIAGSYVLPGIAGVLAQRIATALAAIGVADSINNIVNMITDNGGQSQRETVLNQIKEYGGKMRVNTNYYEYSTGSGNSYTHYTTTSYSWVA